VLAFFLSFRPAAPSRLLVYSLYYAFPARWTGNAKIRRVCGARTRTYRQRPRKGRRVRPVLSEKCYGLLDVIDLAYNEPIKCSRTDHLCWIRESDICTIECSESRSSLNAKSRELFEEKNSAGMSPVQKLLFIKRKEGFAIDS